MGALSPVPNLYPAPPTNMNNINDMIQSLAPYVPLLAPTLALSLMVTLAFLEIKVKLESRALQILLNKDSRAQRRVLLLNCAQILVQLSTLQLRLVSPELQAVSLYILGIKCIQTKLDLIKQDAGGLLASLVYVFLIKPSSFICIIGEVDNIVFYLTTQLVPVLFSFLILILVPLFIPFLITAILLSSVWFLLRLIVLVRRKFPEDFDFFVTMSIFILAWKIMQKDIMQRQVKELVCLSLEKARPGFYSSTGVHELRRWCKKPPLLGDIVQVGDRSGYFGSIENLTQPEDSYFPEIFLNLAFNYRIRMSLVVSSIPVHVGCNLIVTKPPRDESGYLTSALYRVYLLATWILPTRLQSHLAVFGFNSSSLVLQTQMDCTQLEKQLLVEKIN